MCHEAGLAHLGMMSKWLLVSWSCTEEFVDRAIIALNGQGIC